MVRCSGRRGASLVDGCLERYNFGYLNSALPDSHALKLADNPASLTPPFVVSRKGLNMRRLGRQRALAPVIFRTNEFHHEIDVVRFRVVRTRQRLQRRPRNHTLHLLQKQLPPTLPTVLLEHRVRGCDGRDRYAGWRDCAGRGGDCSSTASDRQRVRFSVGVIYELPLTADVVISVLPSPADPMTAVPLYPQFKSAANVEVNSSQ